MTLQTLRSYPLIKLYGCVSEMMHDNMRGEIDALLSPGTPLPTLVFQVATLGGDAEAGERIAEEIRQLREGYGVDCLFFGHTNVMSAGSTIMSAFPREKRYLSSSCVVMLHERQMNKSVQLSGPLTSAWPAVQAVVAEIESSIAVQERTFARLVEGSSVTLDELRRRAASNWYLTADEALERGLVAGVL